MGSPRYLIVYIASGVFGLCVAGSWADTLISRSILGGNFGLVAQPSVGASGAIFVRVEF